MISFSFSALELDDLHLKNDSEESNVDKHSEMAKKNASQKMTLHEGMRDAAHSIYEEYLSEKANQRLKIDESVVKRLLFKIRSEPPNADWFDESQDAIYSKLQVLIVEIVQIHSPHCGNIMIFLLITFYVSSNLRILEVQNLPFLHI